MKDELMIGLFKSHKGSHIFKNHGFPYYDAMYSLLGKTPIAGAHRIGTSTQNKRTGPAQLTPAERALDDSSEDSGTDNPKTKISRDTEEGESFLLDYSTYGAKFLG